jgi:hypothetical protein
MIHSPAPWTITKHTILDANFDTIGIMCPTKNDNFLSHDSVLITLAPDMLQLLRYYVDLDAPDEIRSKAIKILDAVTEGELK